MEVRVMAGKRRMMIGKVDGVVESVDMTLGLRFIVKVRTESGVMRFPVDGTTPDEGDEVVISVSKKVGK